MQSKLLLTSAISIFDCYSECEREILLLMFFAPWFVHITARYKREYLIPPLYCFVFVKDSLFSFFSVKVVSSLC